MVELAAEQGVTLTVDQVRQFLQQMDEEKSLTTLSWMLLPLLLWQVWHRKVGANR